MSIVGRETTGHVAAALAIGSVVFAGLVLATVTDVEVFRFRVEALLDEDVADLRRPLRPDTPRFDTIALGDLNLDGALDLVTVGNLDDLVTVRLGLGDGSFGDRTIFAAEDVDGVTYAPIAVVIEDFTAPFPEDSGAPDGEPDLAVIGEDGEVYILIGDGAGGFLPPDQEIDEFFDLSFPSGAVTGDFDGNGDVDLAIADFDQLVAYCNMAGTFFLCGGDIIEIDELGGDPEITDIAAGDFDGDGYDDVAALSPEEGALYVVYGGEDGVFDLEVPIIQPVEARHGAVATGSFNADEIDDVVTVLPGQFGDNGQVSLGTGGRFFQNLPFAAPETTESIVVAKFDRDSLDDIVFSDATSAWIIPGDGSGDFSAGVGATIATEVGVDNRRLVAAFTLVSGDLDNDQLVDVVGLVSEGRQLELAMNVIDEPLPTRPVPPSSTPTLTPSVPVGTATATLLPATPTATATPTYERSPPPPTLPDTPTRTHTPTFTPTPTEVVEMDDASCAVVRPQAGAGLPAWMVGWCLALVVARRRRRLRL